MQMYGSCLNVVTSFITFFRQLTRIAFDLHDSVFHTKHGHHISLHCVGLFSDVSTRLCRYDCWMDTTGFAE